MSEEVAGAVEACREQAMHLLHDGLFESAEVLCSFMLSSLNRMVKDGNCRYNSIFTELIADSLFARGLFKRASVHFQRALLEKSSRHQIDFTGRVSGSSAIETKDQARLIYKSAVCLIELKDASEAIKLLEKIPVKFRNVKVCAAMGKLYTELGLKKNSAACFKQVLMMLPTSIEAVEQLGKHCNDFASVIAAKTVLFVFPYYKTYINSIVGCG